MFGMVVLGVLQSGRGYSAQLRFNGLGGQVAGVNSCTYAMGVVIKVQNISTVDHIAGGEEIGDGAAVLAKNAAIAVYFHTDQRSHGDGTKDVGVERPFFNGAHIRYRSAEGKVLSSLDVAVVFFDSRFQSVGGNAEFFGQFFDSVGTVDILRLESISA